MASSPKSKTRPPANWFPAVLLSIMQEQKISSAVLAEKIDRSKALVDAVLDGTHVPSLLLAERILQALGHDLEVMAKKHG